MIGQVFNLFLKSSELGAAAVGETRACVRRNRSCSDSMTGVGGQGLGFGVVRSAAEIE